MSPPNSETLSKTRPSLPLNVRNVLPETALAQSAYIRVSTILAPPILAHSIRVYLYATALASHTDSIYISSAAHHDLLLAACLFHDIGTTPTHNSPQRFEIEGADAATNFLAMWNVSAQDQHDVWVAVACHTSPQIAERIGELARLVRKGVLMDFGGKVEGWEVLRPLKGRLEADFSRDGIEKCIGDAVVVQAREKPVKAPMASWPGVMLRAALAEPEWEGVNKAF